MQVPGQGRGGTGVTAPNLYHADAPGRGCDNGGARWTLLEGKVTCTGQRAAYQDAAGSFDWPGRAFTPTYEITLHIDALGPTSCIGILMHEKYGVSACASGGVRILRLKPQATAIAGKPPVSSRGRGSPSAWKTKARIGRIHLRQR